MDYGLMFDTSADAADDIGHLGLKGCVAAAVYLFGGATNADGTPVDPVAHQITAEDIARVHRVGLGVLLVDDGIGWGDTDNGTAWADGFRKGTQAAAKAKAVGAAAGSSIAVDVETWKVNRDFFRGYCAAVDGAGFTVVVYGSLDGDWRAAFAADVASDANVARAHLWLADYVEGTWDGTVPTWQAAWGDAIAVQITEHGPNNTDISLVQLTPKLRFWLADGTAGCPKSPGVAA